ncbi:MAG TPA: helix-turn-helix domain-containing protein [Syntrophorhabdaceae bacterium]|nr:helix-turn-helix domain-containing protein [Syntrophorhabdaceae bacterium]
MEIIVGPSPTLEAASPENNQGPPQHYPVLEPQSENNNGTSAETAQTVTLPADRLFKQMELRLESVVERLLLSKMAENDNLLAGMHEIVEKMFLRSALKITEGNISRAARLLGINRNTLSKKLRALEAGT